MKLKKVISVILIFSMLTCSMVIVGANSKTEIIDNEEFQLLYSLDAKNKTPEEIEVATEKLYKELGIYDAVNQVRHERQKEGIKLIKQEVLVSKQPNQNVFKGIFNSLLGTSGDYTNLTDYKGYGMRYIIVKDVIEYDPVNLDDVADIPIIKALDTAFSVNLGYGSAWVWVPYSFLGIKVSDFAKWLLQIEEATDLYVVGTERLTYKYYEIEDKDDIIPNYDWYCFGITNKSDVDLDMIFRAYDENNNRVQPQTKSELRTFYAQYYYDTTAMKEGVYQAYKYGYGEDIINGIYMSSTKPFNVRRDYEN